MKRFLLSALALIFAGTASGSMIHSGSFERPDTINFGVVLARDASCGTTDCPSYVDATGAGFFTTLTFDNLSPNDQNPSAINAIAIPNNAGTAGDFTCTSDGVVDQAMIFDLNGVTAGNIFALCFGITEVYRFTASTIIFTLDPTIGANDWNTAQHDHSDADSAGQFASSNLSDGAAIVKEDQANTYSGGGLQNFAAAQLEIPQTADPVDAAGEIGVDSTSNQFKVHDGNAVRVVETEPARCRTIESLAMADDGKPLVSYPYAVKIQQGWCECKGACTVTADIQFYDESSNAIGTAVACDGAQDDLSGDADGTLSANELIYFDNTEASQSPETDDYLVCWSYQVTAD